MFIDAHQHFWKYNPVDYNWIDDKMLILKRDFLPPDLYTELLKVDFSGSIAVQARQSVEETNWLLEFAKKYEFIKGVVGWVDLCSDGIENQLAEFSKNPKFVGVRHVIHDEPDDNFMAREDFQHGIGLLAKYGLTYDLLIFPKHLALASHLAEKFPEQKFVLDHIAKPIIKEQIKTPWNTDISRLAKNPNVFCKLSGMVTEADWKLWKPADFYFYIDVIYHAFGEDRIMIGSDWPVCTVAGTYVEIMNIVIDYFTRYNSKILGKILGENCERFYLKK